MKLEEAIKEMKIEIEKFENDLKALEKTDIDVEYKIQIVRELGEYILVRQTILNHITKQGKMIDEIKSKLEEHIQYCKQEAQGSLHNEICYKSLKFNESLLNILKRK